MRQFRIDDSEKDRILNLHESATKRQYLNEQTAKCCTTKLMSDELFELIPETFIIDEGIDIISGGEGKAKLNKNEEFTICFGNGGIILSDKNDFTIKIDLKGFSCDEGFEITTGA